MNRTRFHDTAAVFRNGVVAVIVLTLASPRSFKGSTQLVRRGGLAVTSKASNTDVQLTVVAVEFDVRVRDIAWRKKIVAYGWSAVKTVVSSVTVSHDRLYHQVNQVRPMG